MLWAYSLLYFMDFAEPVNFSRQNGLTLLSFQLKCPSIYSSIKWIHFEESGITIQNFQLARPCAPSGQ